MHEREKFYEKSVEEFRSQDLNVFDMKMTLFFASLQHEKICNDYHLYYPNRFLTGACDRKKLLALIRNLPQLKKFKEMLETRDKDEMFAFETVGVFRWINLNFGKYQIQMVKDTFEVFEVLQNFINSQSGLLPECSFRLNLSATKDEELFYKSVVATEYYLMPIPIEEIYPLLVGNFSGKRNYTLTNDLNICLDSCEYLENWAGSSIGRNIKCLLVVEIERESLENLVYLNNVTVGRKPGNSLKQKSQIRYVLFYTDHTRTYGNYTSSKLPKIIYITIVAILFILVMIVVVLKNFPN